MTIQRPPESTGNHVSGYAGEKWSISNLWNTLFGDGDSSSGNSNSDSGSGGENQEASGGNGGDGGNQDGQAEEYNKDSYFAIDDGNGDYTSAEKYTTYGAIGVYDGYSNDKLADKENIWNTDGTLNDNPLSSQQILGLPFRYNNNADPAGRVFSKTIFQDLPLVYLIPGKPKLNEKIINDSGKSINLDKYYENIEDGGGISWGVKPGLFGKSDDLKYVSFKPNYSEYWKYVQVLTSAVYANFKAQESTDGFKLDLFSFTEEFKNKWNNYGIPFYIDKSSSVSEDLSNTYGTSRIAETVNDKSSETREVAMLGNKNGFSSFITSIKENLKGLSEGIGDAFKSTFSYDYLLTKTSNKLVRIVNGSQLDFPEIWQDSKFDRNYNLTFKFFSPYGDKESVFKYVIVPFLSLLSLALPRQDHVLSYVEPFLVRVISPGMFSIDMGVITSMSIMKGGSENLWTMDNLPRALDVTISIQDLYPTMNQVRTDKMLRYNKSLSMYLETLTGVRTDIINSFGGELKSWVNRKISNSFFFGIDDSIKNHVDDFLYGVQSSIKDIFR